ncbi:beta-lactamase/transpeptidase-like protein [Hyaloraphidium curvatum]|nr:beta-lactamase/transpeptidase-like protein [Hyaloraphidium curvatum]
MAAEAKYNRTDRLVPLPPHDPAVPWPSLDSNDYPAGPLPEVTNHERLKKVLERIRNPDLARHGKTFALLACHKGRLVLEEYGPPEERLTRFGAMTTDPWPKETFDEGTKFVSWSQAKSFVHACFGILLQKGLLKNTQTPAHPWVPEWQGAGDPRREITIEQLLQMRSGLKWEEAYIAPEQHPWPAVLEMIWGEHNHDAAGYAASFPLEHPPGTKFYYSSGTSNILVSILYRILGLGPEVEKGERMEKFTAWIEAELFSKLGIQGAELRFDGSGLWFGSSYVYCKSREFVRFGELYLRDGAFAGNRIFPAGWADTARRLQSTIPRDEPLSDFEYGQQWWVCRDERFGGFAAQGYQGQFTYVVPALDLVIVRNGETPMDVYSNVVEEIIYETRDALAGL